MGTGKVTLDRLCTIEEVRSLRDTLMAAIDAGLEVDASCVERADISVLQLLVSARKECEARGTKFVLTGGGEISRLAARAGLRMDATAG